ncbi:ABC transporter permease [Mycoplasma capricolum subsp. capripneumoniae]|uniref:ABC transporter permease n=1 Tax=Mycoplasma capricolum TaxID=2095 RepID=UPI001404E527|nr:ABC transporter permease [Mycoplasma capricolum]QIN42451.1 ABC transporter permease [Mycoplasma capricolum subsp. capripneumoniae]QIN45880.1 ABC transporter permease [Mycoplasma capricolum subsp. capripneumoniae]QIN47947.1 ABC transporter permease [Mycoplasma capricolum subsp. capripneumoniae]
MKRIYSFFLLLKQGLKGVFKFKIQFIIILLLSFLASFILSTSLTLTSRINKTYNNIVNNVNKFDYSSSNEIRTYRTDRNNSTTDRSVIPLLDLVNNSNSYYNQSSNNKNTSYLNFILNKKNLTSKFDNKTLLTELFENKDFIELFTTISGNNIQWIWENNWLWQLALYFNKFVYHSYEQFLKNSKEYTYLKNTVIGKYLTNSFKDKNEFLNDSKVLKNIKIDNLKNNFNAKDFRQTFNKQIQNKELFSYIYISGMSLFQYIYRNIYLPYFSDFKIENNNKGNSFYTFLTGSKLNNISDSQADKWVISDKNKSYLTEFELNKTKINESDNSILISNQNNKEDIKKLILEKGMKGNTELVLITSDNQKVQLINPIINDTSLFKLLFYNGNGTSVTNVVSVLSDTNFIKKDIIIGENQFDNIELIHNIWLAHLKYTALASGYDINFRTEVFNYDSVTQIRYRLIVLNDNHTTNLTILNKNQGARSPTKSEALISEQFARAHKLKLGQQIIVDSALLSIVGFATDAYSFFPTTDPDFPIPQSGLGAILYVNKSTIKDILSSTSQSNTNRVSKGYLSFFLTKKHSIASIDMFNAYQMNDISKLYDSIKYQKEQKNKVSTWLNIKDFDHSIFRFNWTIAPLAINTYKISTLIAALAVSLIAIIALIICIRKTIYFNAKQIGILKALGSSPLQISISYLAYILVIILTSVPLGWIVGLSTQSVFVKLFVHYFSIPLYSFTIEPFSLLISLLIFGLFGLIISLLTAFLITKKPLFDILAVKQNWSNSKFINRLKRTWFKKARFTTKFSLTLASSGKKNIFLLVTVVGISTMFISAGLAIPSIAFTIKNTYYKSIKYANEYNYAKGVTNSPLTKPTINYWNGQEELDKNISSTILNNQELFYYNDPTAYVSSSYDVNPFPKYLYKLEELNKDNIKETKSKLAWTLLELIQNKDHLNELNKTNSLDLLFTEMFGNNLYNVVGNQFSIGVIDQILGLILNSKDNVINPNDKNTKWTDEQKDLIFKELTNNFTKTGITAISILVNDLSTSKSDDWKTKIFDAILKAVPPYVSAYIQKPSRKEQFSIGYNVQHYIPDHETLTTVSDIKATINQKNTNLVLTGISNNQSAFIINQKNVNNLFVDYKKLLALQEVFLEKKSNDIKLNDQFLLYDSKNNQINLPVLPNKQASAFYNLNKATDISNILTTSKQFFINTKNGYVNLPKHAWVYDDLNFIKSKYYNLLTEQQKQLISKFRTGRNSSAVNSDDIRWLDPYNLDNNKFTLKLLYDQDRFDNDSTYDNKERTLLNNSYMFDDFTYNNQFDDLLSSYIRPYYQYKNIQIYIPQSLIDIDQIINISNSKKTQDQLKNNTEHWYKKDIDYNKVPKSVIKAWDIKDSNEKFLMIRPYDLRFTLTIDNVYKSGLSNLIAKPEYWMYQSTKTNNLAKLNAQIIQKDANTVYQNKDLKIVAKPVGTLDSYNQKLILTDQGLMNLVLNLSIGKKIAIKDNFYNRETVIKAGEKYNDIISRFDRYDFNQITNYLDKNKNKKEFNNLLFSKKDPFNQAQFLWHNSKYSNIEEALDLTSGISFIPDTAYNGFYILNGHGASSASGDDDMISSIKNQNLLATSKTLINQITFIAISIGMLLIITVIITSALLVMLISDIYVTQYQQFMILMKALGYSNYKISKYAFGTAVVFSLFAWAASTALTWILITLIIKIITALGFAIPYGFLFWTLIVSFIIITISFIGSLIVSSNKIRTKKPASLLTVSNE